MCAKFRAQFENEVSYNNNLLQNAIKIGAPQAELKLKDFTDGLVNNDINNNINNSDSNNNY